MFGSSRSAWAPPTHGPEARIASEAGPQMEAILPIHQPPAWIAATRGPEGQLTKLLRALPSRRRIRWYEGREHLTKHLRAETPLWILDLQEQQRVLVQWAGGRRLVPLLLGLWSGVAGTSKGLERLARLHLAMEGRGPADLAWLDALSAWPGRHLLVTEGGVTDPPAAGQPVQRVALGRRAPAQRLIAAVENALFMPDPRIETLWALGLSPAQLALLREASVARHLLAFARANWDHWAFVGRPFGGIGVDFLGQWWWLPLASPTSLRELAQESRARGLPAADVARIRTGLALPAHALESLGARSVSPNASARALSVGDHGELLGALIPMVPMER